MAAYEAALKSRDDASLEMTLGKLYLDRQADTTRPLAHFQQASSLAWNDQSTHLQLMMDYRQADRPDLAAKETEWLKAVRQGPPRARRPRTGCRECPARRAALPAGSGGRPAGPPRRLDPCDALGDARRRKPAQ